MKKDKLLKKALNNPGNLHFGEFERLLCAYGFERIRSKGSHVHYFSPGCGRLLPVQEKNGMAKEYQVIQFLSILEEHDVI